MVRWKSHGQIKDWNCRIGLAAMYLVWYQVDVNLRDKRCLNAETGNCLRSSIKWVSITLRERHE
jgi:hypothetical protein